MLTLMATIALLIQDPPAPTPVPTQGSSQDDVDREVRRLKQRLELTDEQEAKIREIVKAEAEARKASREKMREVLTDEQKTKFDQRFGGAGAMDERAREAMRRAGEASSTGKSLQKELGLTDEQVAKIDEVVKEAGGGGPQRVVTGADGGFDMEEFNRKHQESHKALGEKIKPILTDEQKPKFDEIWAKRAPQGNMRIMGAGGEFRWAGGALQGLQGGATDPMRQPPAERAKRALEALRIDKADEAAAVRSLVDLICAAQKELAEHGDRMVKRARDLAKDTGVSDETLAKELETLREERRAIEKRVAASQKDLREVVTYKQEAMLIEHGVLR